MIIKQPLLALITTSIPNIFPLSGRDLRVGHRYKFITNSNKQFYAEFIRLTNGPYGQLYHIKNVSNINNQVNNNKEYLYPVNAVTPYLV